mmetsp:Transcript_61211/g.99093  ORF Transcript_61211/g.99093 Transcript_61211/m.99093 type:complete len:89 (+) Transcript_61211:1073-1339(+)
MSRSPLGLPIACEVGHSGIPETAFSWDPCAILFTLSAGICTQRFDLGGPGHHFRVVSDTTQTVHKSGNWLGIFGSRIVGYPLFVLCIG